MLRLCSVPCLCHKWCIILVGMQLIFNWIIYVTINQSVAQPFRNSVYTEVDDGFVWPSLLFLFVLNKKAGPFGNYIVSTKVFY